MKINWMVRKVAKFLVAAALFVGLFGFFVMNLWNSLMPALFGWHAIGFWQAVGLLVLSRIFFGGFHGRSGPRVRWRRRMHERWEAMTPEEREKFRQGMRGRCGSFRPPETEAKA